MREGAAGLLASVTRVSEATSACTPGLASPRGFLGARVRGGCACVTAPDTDVVVATATAVDGKEVSGRFEFDWGCALADDDVVADVAADDVADAPGVQVVVLAFSRRSFD